MPLKSHLPRFMVLLWISVLWLPSCVSDVNPDFSNFRSKVVVNALLNPDSTFRVSLSESLPIDKEEIFPPFDNGDVEISDGETTISLTSRSNGVFESEKKPVSGRSYQLKVQTNDGGIITAGTRVPLPPRIEITHNPEGHFAKVTITDNPEEKNYYWLGLYSGYLSDGHLYPYSYLEIDSPLIDDFNREESIKIGDHRYFSYHFLARLPDHQFNGKEMSFRILQAWTLNPEYEYDFLSYALFVIHADEHYDKYLKSALIQYDQRAYGDIMVFYTPVDMYSNVENGDGIFGSCTFHLYDITTP